MYSSTPRKLVSTLSGVLAPVDRPSWTATWHNVVPLGPGHYFYPSFWFDVHVHTIAITGNTVIRSHAAIETMGTMGIALLMHPGAHLSIRTPLSS